MQKFITSEEIYNDLCHKIEYLEYKPGERISEADLSRVYDTTRHVVRGAISRLKDRGLVEVYPQRGTYVSLIDMELVDDILYMREAVEQEAISRIITRGDNASLVETLRELIGLQRSYTEEHRTFEETHAVDNRFHRALLITIGKGNVMDLIDEKFIHVRRWTNLDLERPERQMEIVEEHGKLADAIEAGDRVLAHRILHHHINTVGRFEADYQKAGSEYFVYTGERKTVRA